MRTRWSNELRETQLRAAVRALSLPRMPTASELRTLDGGNALAIQLSRHGGLDAWADRIGLLRADHDSRRGWRWETVVAQLARDRGLEVEERPTVKSPWDLKIRGRTVDVKSAVPAWVSGGFQWTWRIGKQPVVDVVVLVAVGQRPRARTVVRPDRFLIVPAAEVPATCATSRTGGKWFRWMDRWDLLAATP